MEEPSKDSVSIIITVADGAEFVQPLMKSILEQTWKDSLECVVYLDHCADNTEGELLTFKEQFDTAGISLKLIKGTEPRRGVGYGRNRAIEACSGQYLCFQDIDDVMYPRRIELQLHAAKENTNAIIGSKFVRPDDSTKRFTEWANELPKDLLTVQIYTTNGPTIIMPTWFCHRKVFDRIPGGFNEGGRGVPEDLIFFYDHLDRGGDIDRVDEVLLFYNYHKAATTFSIQESTIFKVRLEHLLSNVLCTSPWREGFSIWNAGKAGKQFFKALPEDTRKLVKCFCDVDQRKIGKTFNHFDPVLRREVSAPVPIVSYKDAQPPLIICMKLNLTQGQFEENLKSLCLTEGVDYLLFP